MSCVCVCVCVLCFSLLSAEQNKSATALDAVKGYIWTDLFNDLFPAFLIMTYHTLI